MHVLITGGAGFIGTHTVDAALAAGHSVSVIDCLDPFAHSSHPRWLRPEATYRWGDVADDAVWDGLDQPDAVIHLAAKVGLGVDISDVRSYVHQNDVGTASLIYHLNRAGFEGRVVLASSMVVYGEGVYVCPEHGDQRPGPRAIADLDAGRFDPMCPTCGTPLQPGLITEDAMTDPRNVYASTKLHQEHLMSSWVRESKATVVALRYHNVYGPRMPQQTPYAGVASIFRSSVEHGRSPIVFEDGQQRRDFVHVHDVARANVLAAAHPDATPFRAFNISSGQPISLLDMARSFSATRDIEPIVQPTYRLGDVRHIVADPAAARDGIGFWAAIGPTEGLAAFASDELRDPPSSR